MNRSLRQDEKVCGRWSRFSIGNLLFLALGVGLGLMIDDADPYLTFRTNPPTVCVTGAVASPSEFRFSGQLCVLEALALAGGLHPQADASSATITRTNNGNTPMVTVIDMNEPNASTILLRPGDVLEIPGI